jgi:transposase
VEHGPRRSASYAVRQRSSSAALAGATGPVRGVLPRAASLTPYVEPDWGRIHQKLSRKGVTLLLLWEEHAAARTWR